MTESNDSGGVFAFKAFNGNTAIFEGGHTTFHSRKSENGINIWPSGLSSGDVCFAGQATKIRFSKGKSVINQDYKKWEGKISLFIGRKRTDISCIDCQGSKEASTALNVRIDRTTLITNNINYIFCEDACSIIVEI